MATHNVSAPPIVTATLSADTIDTVQFPDYTGAITVENVSGGSAINVMVNGEEPAVGGSKRFEVTVPAAHCRVTIPTREWNEATQVKLVSSGEPEYKVSEATPKLGPVEIEYL